VGGQVSRKNHDKQGEQEGSGVTSRNDVRKEETQEDFLKREEMTGKERNMEDTGRGNQREVLGIFHCMEKKGGRKQQGKTNANFMDLIQARPTITTCLVEKGSRVGVKGVASHWVSTWLGVGGMTLETSLQCERALCYGGKAD